MIHELSIEQFTKIVVKTLQEIIEEIVLANPQTASIFPCGVVSLPMKRIEKTEGGIPVRCKFSISVEWWANKKYEAMDYSGQADIVLRNIGLTRTITNVDNYDDVTKKHRYGGQYEVFFNGLTNSFDRTK